MVFSVFLHVFNVFLDGFDWVSLVLVVFGGFSVASWGGNSCLCCALLARLAAWV